MGWAHNTAASATRTSASRSALRFSITIVPTNCTTVLDLAGRPARTNAEVAQILPFDTHAGRPQVHRTFPRALRAARFSARSNSRHHQHVGSRRTAFKRRRYREKGHPVRALRDPAL